MTCTAMNRFALALCLFGLIGCGDDDGGDGGLDSATDAAVDVSQDTSSEDALSDVNVSDGGVDSGDASPDAADAMVPDAGTGPRLGNRIVASIDGVTYHYTNRMVAPGPFESGVQTVAYADDAPTTSWNLMMPAAVGVYSCAEGGEASVGHRDQGGLGAATANSGGSGACTFEVLSAGPVWRATFSGAAYHRGTEKTITDGYFEFDPETAPGGGASDFPAEFNGVLITITEPASLADSYLVRQIRSENDGDNWLFVAQNMLVAPEFKIDMRNVPRSAGTYTCADDGLSFAFQNNINGKSYWQNGGSCSIDITAFEASGVVGTFEADLPALVGGPGSIRLSGRIRATAP